jgi:ABC-type polysaccharide/polyol phosphate export permease
VGVILQRDRYEDFPLFIFAAILPWKWFDATVKAGLGTVVGAERLIKQIYFPKLVLPIAVSASGVVNFLFGLIPLVFMMIVFYPHRLTLWILLVPVIAIVQLVFSTAVGIAVSALNVFYRDIGNVARHLMRFWFYLSPTLYGLDMVREITAKQGELAPVIKTWYALNPFTYLIGAYRDVIYYGTAPHWSGLANVGIVSLVLLTLAILLFKRLEPNFAKVL